jgi:hypothetical protein
VCCCFTIAICTKWASSLFCVAVAGCIAVQHQFLRASHLHSLQRVFEAGILCSCLSVHGVVHHIVVVGRFIACLKGGNCVCFDLLPLLRFVFTYMYLRSSVELLIVCMLTVLLWRLREVAKTNQCDMHNLCKIQHSAVMNDLQCSFFCYYLNCVPDPRE